MAEHEQVVQRASPVLTPSANHSQGSTTNDDSGRSPDAKQISTITTAFQSLLHKPQISLVIYRTPNHREHGPAALSTRRFQRPYHLGHLHQHQILPFVSQRCFGTRQLTSTVVLQRQLSGNGSSHVSYRGLHGVLNLTSLLPVQYFQTGLPVRQRPRTRTLLFRGGRRWTSG